jgi:uncharacterized protein
MDEIYSLQGITFVWNAKKAKTNRADHRVSFEKACEVFFDPFLFLIDASRMGEERDAVLGEDTTGRLLFVVHIQQEGDLFRLISARKATPTERKTYESQ